MLQIAFCPVPDFIRELPVTSSGPTIISIGISASAASGESGLLQIQAVRMPCSRARCSAPITYGVVPDAAMPITVSSGEIFRSSSSCQPRCGSSSACSTGFRNAVSPPAIRPTTSVGGIRRSAGSPRRPARRAGRSCRLPGKKMRPPFCIRSTMAVTSFSICGIALPTASGTFRSSSLISSSKGSRTDFCSRLSCSDACSVILRKSYVIVIDSHGNGRVLPSACGRSTRSADRIRRRSLPRSPYNNRRPIR